MVRNPAIVALAANAGLDFLMLDMEHGAYDFESVADCALLARAMGIGCFARVPELSKGNISRVLDCGVTAVMVPMIRNAEDAIRFVSWAKYAPIGERGFGSNSGHTEYHNQGGNSGCFMEKENDRVLTIAQIELSEAIQDIDAIASVPGLDALLVGPADLSNSLGIPGQFNHPDMVDAIAKVSDACKTHGKIFGLHAGESFIRKWIPFGLTLRMSEIEINMLSKGMEALNVLRD
jgi:2-keto-3-deoxy-L-rhamnonate aldolase RhmA